MKIGAILVLLTVLGSGCAGEDHDEVLLETVVTLERTAELLEAVTDTDQIDQARAALEARIAELTILKERALGLHPLPPDVETKERAVYEARLRSAQSRIDRESTRLLSRPTLRNHLVTPLTRLSTLWGTAPTD